MFFFFSPWEWIPIIICFAASSPHQRPHHQKVRSNIFREGNTPPPPPPNHSPIFHTHLCSTNNKEPIPNVPSLILSKKKKKEKKPFAVNVTAAAKLVHSPCIYGINPLFPKEKVSHTPHNSNKKPRKGKKKLVKSVRLVSPLVTYKKNKKIKKNEIKKPPENI
jgi:hypothetical protein